MRHRFQSFYFDWVYTPFYDGTVAQLAPYCRFLDSSLNHLSLAEESSVLCVGVGTGNELRALYDRNATTSFSIVAVDVSQRGFVRARRKTADRGASIQFAQMAAHQLAFIDNQFDLVLCLHTLDFVGDPVIATREMLRVIKGDGKFVFSYPTGVGSVGLVQEVGASVARKLSQARFVDAIKETVASVGAGFVYAPLALAATMSSKRQVYTRAKVERLLEDLNVNDYTVYEDPRYLRWTPSSGQR